MSLGYVTPAEAAAFMGWASPDTADTADLTLMIPIAELMVNDYCRTTFVWEPNVTKIFSGDGFNCLVPGRFISTLYEVDLLDSDGNIVTVAYKSTNPSSTNDVVLQPDEPIYGAYRWLERKQAGSNAGISTFTYNVRQQLQNVWPEGSKNIVITADWGYQTTPLPVKFAVAQTVKMLFDSRSINEFIKSEAGAGRIVQQGYFGDPSQFIPSLARAMLKEFVNSQRFS